MKKSYRVALHIFRRDLRLIDNHALTAAHRSSEQVVPCFIFDKRQVGSENIFKSDNAIEFMVNSLKELRAALHDQDGELYFFDGEAEKLIPKLIKQYNIEAIFINRDYTPYSCKRDRAIAAACEKANIDFHLHADALLNEPEEVSKPDGKPYTLFTPYFKKAKQLTVSKPYSMPAQSYCKLGKVDLTILNKLSQRVNDNLFLKGGRKEALKLIKHLPKIIHYDQSREFPALVGGTSNLSPHLKFGTISCREVYAAVANTFNKSHSLIRELYWRDFFTQIAFHFPHVFGKAFREKYQHIKWASKSTTFQSWCDGLTGFPIVDAGMRQLNQTGYMHNRVRMIVASFLTKDLHINWQAGEQYFAQKLIDYDPAVNNGNWQWAASTGCDAQPYFRVFNPWRQQKKFDPDCAYIKEWLPELRHLAAKEIHQLETNQHIKTYPKMMVNHSQAAEIAKKLYRQSQP